MGSLILPKLEVDNLFLCDFSSCQSFLPSGVGPRCLGESPSVSGSGSAGGCVSGRPLALEALISRSLAPPIAAPCYEAHSLNAMRRSASMLSGD
jgi:hypothetical protein